MKKTINFIFAIIVSILMFSCESERATTTAEISEDDIVENLSYNQLPNSIKDAIEGSLKSINESHSKETLFGALDRTSLKRILKGNKEIYSASLHNLNNGLYSDNLQIVKSADQNPKVGIIRYEPSKTWYGEKILGISGDENFGGKITFFDKKGHKILSNEFFDGTPKTDKASKLTDRNSCKIVDIQYTAVNGSEGMVIIGVTVYVECDGQGGTSGNGNPGEGTQLDFDFDNPGGGVATTTPFSIPKPEEYPSCESFEYTRVGTANWIATGVSGVFDTAIKLDKCPGIAIASYREPLYFQLPGSYSNEQAASISAFYLWTAFENWGAWYRRTYNNDCISEPNNPAVRAQLLTEIKDSFAEIGGRVDKVPPAGYSGVTIPFKVAGISGDFFCD